MAAGKVCTGFSLPHVAVYSGAGGTVTYTNGMQLARGVDVTISPDSASDNKFYADNVACETAAGVFTGGSFNVTVDGLLPAAEKLIMGLPAPGSDGWTAYDDNQVTPYVGFGFIARYMSDGVTSYVPIVLKKCVFDPIQTSAATQTENIDFQTQSLSGRILRADDSAHTWKEIGGEDTTEAAALAALKTKLGIA